MLADQIHLAIIEMPVRHDRRITRQKIRQHRQHEIQTESGAHADPQAAGRHAAAAAQALQRALNRLQATADFLQKTLAFFGQDQLASVALEQAHANQRLQPGDVFAHRRRAEAQLAAGGGKAAVFRAADEAFQMSQHTFPLWISN